MNHPLPGMWLLQRVCDIQVASAALGPMRPLSEGAWIQAHREAAALQPGVCRAAFDALVRKVDSLDSSYKDAPSRR